jgi:hypothetical protein
MNFGSLYKRAPSAARPAHTVAFTSSSTAATLTGASSECGDANGAWYTFVCSQACHIIFGDANVAVSTTSQMLYPPNVPIDIWLSVKLETHLRVIRDTADGSLYWYKSES